ncbi:phosphoribosyltransferase family protein [Embleya sp. NPDC020886]|uniref:phosphoribosyltransferase family protein n=1 Tax=Embleya sp. NPDC020886 TaxID=3363980 RepID=UPI003787E811
MIFRDRLEAGRILADRLGYLKGEDVVVLGLPRGGVPVAAEVAEVLAAPLDVCLVRKLGVPHQPELAMGAIGEDGVRVVDPGLVRRVGVTDAALAAVEERERRTLAERARSYRGSRPPVDIAGRTVVLVDDGVATGATARAACRVARDRRAARIVLAVPVAPSDVVERMGKDADEVVCPHPVVDFLAVGQFYTDFSQTSDGEVVACLEQAAADAPHPPVSDTGDVEMAIGGVRLGGRLRVPDGAAGIVVFAHGSGSSRHSPRNRFVADALTEAGVGTLLFDLLSDEEEQDRANVFDIELLARRLAGATDWLRARDEGRRRPVGYFGASTGAAAALWAAAEPDSRIAAVVSRGGRPDLAGARLPSVTAPTLLIVGGDDHLVLDLNRQAQQHLRCANELAIVPGATHLFAEPGTLEAATALAEDWFLARLRPRPER